MARHFRKSDERGFAVLVLLVVLLALAAIAAGAILPSILQRLNASQREGAASELEALHLAILGDQATTFGYYGDVGAYPGSLMDLVRDPTGSTAGWKGPYLNVPAGSIVSGQLVDAYGDPLEYYLVDNTQNNPDRVAVVSRGPDGLSTNSSSTPNTASTFAGTAPTDNTYLSQTQNADNATFPSLNSANNDTLPRRFVLGTFKPTISTFDYNAAVNATTGVCPSLYTMTLTSASRGSSDVRTEKPGPVSSFDLQQGAWQVNITSPLASAPLFSQTITILPNATAAPVINLTGLNSAGTATLTLALKNKTATGLDVYISNVKNATVAPANQTTNYTVPGCAPVVLKNTGTATVIDAFTMPYTVSSGKFEKVEGVATVQLTIVNNSTDPEARVYANGSAGSTGVQIGQVARKKQQTYTVNTNDFVTVTDNQGNTLSGTPVQISGTTTLTF